MVSSGAYHTNRLNTLCIPHTRFHLLPLVYVDWTFLKAGIVFLPWIYSSWHLGLAAENLPSAPIPGKEKQRELAPSEHFCTVLPPPRQGLLATLETLGQHVHFYFYRSQGQSSAEGWAQVWISALGYMGKITSTRHSTALCRDAGARRY